MRVSIFPSEKLAAAAIARQVADRVAARPDLVLGLPTGRTPIPLYRELIALHKKGEADFSRAATFNLDEFIGVGPDHPGSYRRFMEQHFFAHINLSPDRIGFMNGLAANAEAEGARYEQAIRDAGGIDLMLLGIGTNGHIGFNEPCDVLPARTHRVVLEEPTRAANALWFGGNVAAVPRAALSMGMATILNARAVVLMATGEGKVDAVREMMTGGITTEVPASFLQLHPRVTVMLDEAAAAGLQA